MKLPMFTIVKYSSLGISFSFLVAKHTCLILPLQAEILDLSYNDLPEITADLFQGLEMLQHLNLEGNSIRDIATGAFQSMPLLLLWLPYNCLTAVTSKMFQGAPFLKQVSLAHNNIRSIEVRFCMGT